MSISMARTLPCLLCIAVVASALEDTCTVAPTVDEAALVQKDLQIRSYSTSEAATAKEDSIRGLRQFEQAADSIEELVNDMNHTMHSHFTKNAQDFHDLVHAQTKDLMWETHNLVRDVENAGIMFRPVIYIAKPYQAPLVATLIAGFDGGPVDKGIKDAREKLLYDAIDRSDSMNSLVKEAVAPVTLSMKDLRKAIAEAEGSDDLDGVRKSMVVVDKSLQNAENLLDSSIARHGQQRGEHINEQIWKMEDSISMFKHDMRNMKDLATKMNLDEKIAAMFDVFDGQAQTIQEMIEGLHGNLTAAGSQLETHHLMNTTNQALDGAMEAAYLLLPAKKLDLLEEIGAASSLVPGLLAFAGILAMKLV